MKMLKFRWMVYGATALAMVISLSLIIPIVVAPPRATAKEPKPLDAFQKQVLPLLERYCVDCHTKDESEAGIVLDRFDEPGGGRQGRPDLAAGARCAAGTHHAAEGQAPALVARSSTGSSRGSKTTSWPPSAASKSARHRS